MLVGGEYNDLSGTAQGSGGRQTVQFKEAPAPCAHHEIYKDKTGDDQVLIMCIMCIMLIISDSHDQATADPDVAQRPTFPLRNTLNFRLRHFHAVAPPSALHTHILPTFPYTPLSTLTPSLYQYQSLSCGRRVHRPPQPFWKHGPSMRGQSMTLGWEEDEITGPDVSKRETLLLSPR